MTAFAQHDDGSMRLIVSREEAASTGAKRYFTGEPCRRAGHICENYVCRSRCVLCDKANTAARNAANPENNRARSNAWSRANPERAAAAKAAWKVKNPERVRELNASWVAANPKKKMLTAAKYRAKKAGVPFDNTLTIDDIVIPDFCPILPWIKLVVAHGSKTDASPSLDQINPANGYIRGNIRVISWRANELKSNGDIAELVNIGLDAQHRSFLPFDAPRFFLTKNIKPHTAGDL